MSSVVEQPVDTVTIEVDGVSMEVPRNSMIIEATDKVGIQIPRFCYHKKLSIAANCRMCLVDVEKAPKPLPACATPVMDGMKVFTKSRRAIDAQHGVMEFLLINHPLDCPICDQGGECELQDQAMGYGRSVSRFTERKRVVKDKNVGPLIQTEMTRCIHCTRCVRFLEEIGGTSEMGGSGRGDRTEIGTCLENSIDSELSGNVIDLCPVGALTNKPFRFSARAWEMMAKPSHAAHDGVGSSLHYHTRRGDIMRAVPREAESVNESWLSDRDRYSHFGLGSSDRVTTPQIKRDGQWVDVDWNEALAAAAEALKSVPAEQLGVLMSPSASNEEYHLASRISRGLGCANIDHRLREQDFADDGYRPRGFKSGIAGLQESNSILLLGCNVRHEAPILGHRVRQAWLSGSKIMAINPLGWNFHFDLSADILAAPQHLAGELAGLAGALAESTSAELPGYLATGGVQVSETHRAMAKTLLESDSSAVMVGLAAMSQSDASRIRALAGWIADASNSELNLLDHGGNSMGACLNGALPAEGGLNARQMQESARSAYLVWDFEPEADTANPAMTVSALNQAESVVAVSSFASTAIREAANVILPLSAWAESEGSLTNIEGRVFQVQAAGKRAGDSRPGWKILRQLGHLLAVDGCAQVSLAEVQSELASELPANKEGEPSLASAGGQDGLCRVGEVPMYSVDALCRHAAPLQASVHAKNDFVGLNPEDASRLGLSDGDSANVEQGGSSVQLPVRVTGRVPGGAVWLRSAHSSVSNLGDAMGAINVTASQKGAE